MSEYANQTLTSKAHRPHPVLRAVVPLMLIGAAVIAATVLVKTKSKPPRRPPTERVAIVDVEALKRTTGTIKLVTSGTVVPSRAVTLQPRVAGQISKVDPRFVPGGRFRQGEVLLEIDPTDYELAVTNLAASLAKAEYDLQVELGMQDVAKHDWEALQTMTAQQDLSALDKSLALREPHLSLVRQNLAAARAQLRQSKLNLERTSVCAPFNAVVRSRTVDVGSQIGTQTALAQLAGTDTYWVLVTIPASQSHWVTTGAGAGGRGSAALVTSVPGIDLLAEWKGRVLRQLPDLEPAGRQAQFIVEVPGPDKPSSGAGQLPLGAYVSVTIKGPDLSDVFRIPRRAVREGSNVWLMNAASRLESRPVTALWSDDEFVLVRTGLEEGEKLVVTDISTPLAGMLLSTEEATKQAQAPAHGSSGPPADRKPANGGAH